MQITKEHIKMLDIIIKISIDNASRAFSKAIKHGALIELARTELVDVSEITEEMNNDFREMAGAMLQLNGALKGKLLFMIPFDGALVLQDYYMCSPQGTSTEFNEYTAATVQEIGNILASSIGNSLASDFGSTVLPTPPQVICDFAGTIFSSLILEEGIVHDKILLIEAKFKIYHTEIDSYFFLLLDIDTMEELLSKLEQSTRGT
jgi:chemotaxis protein CheY-P-specific phosphatase CheC